MTRATVGFMLLPLIERSPELAWMAEEGRESNWDFFFTAAVLALVGAKRSREGTLAERAKVLKRCDEEANRWDPQASEATIDFMTFFDKNVEAGFAPETAIGVWLLVNVRGEWPTHDQMGPAPGLGAMVIKIASEWY